MLALPPALQARLVDAVRSEVQKATPVARGRPPVVLCPPQIRVWVRKLIEAQLPSVAVLSYNEMIRGVEVESHGMVVLTNEA